MRRLSELYVIAVKADLASQSDKHLAAALVLPSTGSIVPKLSSEIGRLVNDFGLSCIRIRCVFESRYHNLHQPVRPSEVISVSSSVQPGINVGCALVKRYTSIIHLGDIILVLVLEKERFGDATA